MTQTPDFVVFMKDDQWYYSPTPPILGPPQEYGDYPTEQAAIDAAEERYS